MFAYWLLFAIFALGTMRAEIWGTQWRTAAAGGAPGRGPGIPAPPARSELLLIAAAVFTAIMIGLRFQVGADWETYNLIYEYIDRFSFGRAIEFWEPGYVLINKLSRGLGAGIWLVNLVCGLVFMYGLVQFARRQPNPWLAMLVGVPYLIIGVGMGYTRQAVAIGCVMAGLAALSRGSFPKLVVWILIGAMFHRSAVVMLPLVTLSYTRNILQTLIVAAIGAFVGYQILAGSIDTYQRVYLDRLYVAQGSGVRLAMNLPPALLFLTMARRFGLSREERSVWRNFSIAAVISFVMWLMTPNTVAIDRLALNLIPLQIFVLSRLPSVMSKSEAPSAEFKMLVILYCAAVQFTWLVFANHAKYWVPYQFYPLA